MTIHDIGNASIDIPVPAALIPTTIDCRKMKFTKFRQVSQITIISVRCCKDSLNPAFPSSICKFIFKNEVPETEAIQHSIYSSIDLISEAFWLLDYRYRNWVLTLTRLQRSDTPNVTKPIVCTLSKQLLFITDIYFLLVVNR